MRQVDSVNLIETMPTQSGEVPLGFNFVHLQNADGDDVIRYIWAESGLKFIWIT